MIKERLVQLPDKIETERLLIRPFHREDLDRYLDFMVDEQATRYLMFTEEQKTKTGAKELFDAIVASYDSEQPIFAYAIATESDGFIGSCGASKLNDDLYECYYSLLPAYWGQGYATEATTAIIDYLFEDTGADEVRAYMAPENTRSAAVAARIGMVERGIQKHPQFGNEGLLYTITREQWLPS
jgi:RimJ/RimL family protein N-acetyltransferase